jgi:hypothetical protein
MPFYLFYVASAAGHRVGCLAMPKAAGFAPLPMPVSGKPWLFCGAFKTEEAGDLFKDASLNPDTRRTLASKTTFASKPNL